MNDQINLIMAELRQKVRDNTITPDECKRAIETMRQGRVAAAATSSKSRSATAAKKSIDSDAMLNELEGL